MARRSTARQAATLGLRCGVPAALAGGLERLARFGREAAEAGDGTAVLRLAAQAAVEVLGARAAAVLQEEGAAGRLGVAASVGISPEALSRWLQGPAARRARRALALRRPLETPAIAPAAALPGADGALPSGVRRILWVPMVGRGDRPAGILMVGWPAAAGLPTGLRRTLAWLLAQMAASACDRVRLASESRDLYLSGIRSLVAAIDARDPSARGHSQRVAFYSRRIAEVLGMPPDRVERVELAALLHDVGKIGIADSVLRKPAPLDPAERAVMMAHVELGARIVGANPALADLVPLVRHHHEWYSGQGYPDGLAGEAIPLGAAIIGVADAFDTMTTGRPYRRASTLEEAMAELRRCAGTQFHPRVVEALCRALEEDEAAGAAYVFHLKGWLQESGEAAGPSAAPPAAGGAAAAGRPSPALPGAAVLGPAGHGRLVAVLYRMAETVREVTDVPSLLQQVLRFIESELGYRDGAVFLVDRRSQDLLMVAASGAFAGLEGLRLARDQGVNGWVASHGVPALVPDVSREPRYHPGPPTTRSEVVVPMVAGSGVIGTLTVDSPRLDAFSVEEVQILAAIAQQAAVAVEAARLQERLRQDAVRDPLTRLYTHRYFHDRLEEELERAARFGHGLQVAIGDVDGLKEFNQRFGRLAGDAVLASLAEVLRRSARRYDTLARYGGDEFAIIVPQADRQGARAALARLDRAVAAASVEWHGESLALPSLSWGLAGFPEDGSHPSRLLAAAQARLYEAKRRRASPGGGPSP